MSAGILVCSSDDDIDPDASNQFDMLEVSTGLSLQSKRSDSIDWTAQWSMISPSICPME